MEGRAGDTGRRNHPSQGSGGGGGGAESWHISSFENSSRKKISISSMINFSV